ncbi:MAG: type II secretion system F family protein, partial [Gemmataceae bacterium]
MTVFSGAVVGSLYWVSQNRMLRAKAEALALSIPGIGGCFQAFALQRFSLTLFMAIEAGLRADRALKLSLRATSNQRYMLLANSAKLSARKGSDITSILGMGGDRLFPQEFLSQVQVGEESGRLAEVMRQQAKYYAEESKRKFRFLARLLAGLTYAMVGILIIVMIFKIITTAYLNPLNDAIQAADNPQKWLGGR